MLWIAIIGGGFAGNLLISANHLATCDDEFENFATLAMSLVAFYLSYIVAAKFCLMLFCEILSWLTSAEFRHTHTFAGMVRNAWDMAIE